MKTLSVTAARQKLGHWLKKTLEGEDIGVIIDGQIVALRPVKVYSEDYAQVEYGVSGPELDRFAERVDAEIDAEKRSGSLKPYKGRLRRA